jgi:hypothetical protein
MHNFARRNLAAHTEPGGCYPQYVSINEERGLVSITVRSPLEPCGECGATACATLTVDQFKALAHEALANLMGQTAVYLQPPNCS